MKECDVQEVHTLLSIIILYYDVLVRGDLLAHPFSADSKLRKQFLRLRHFRTLFWAFGILPTEIVFELNAPFGSLPIQVSVLGGSVEKPLQASSVKCTTQNAFHDFERETLQLAVIDLCISGPIFRSPAGTRDQKRIGHNN